MNKQTTTPETQTPLTDAEDTRLRSKYFPHAFGSTYKDAMKFGRQLELRVRELEAALNEIARWDDDGAHQHWKATGSYGEFDEPWSVKIARECLVPKSRPASHTH